MHDSLRRGRNPGSDQRGVWREIDRKVHLHRAASPSHALQDPRFHLSERLDAFWKLVRDLPEGTSGVVVAIGERLVLLEVLAGPCTFARVFRKLLSGYAFATRSNPSASSFIEAVAKPAHEQHPAVGAGRDVRFEAEGISGYALIGERDVPHAAFAG